MANVPVNVEKTIPLGESESMYLGSIAFDSSYPSGGEVIDIASNTRIRKLFATASAGYVFQFDAANQKLKVFRQKDPAATGGADIPLPEVANTADLSALTAVDFVAFGY